jgi:hypothetical protein
MNCAQCGKRVRSDQCVRLNNAPLHAEACFEIALKGLRRPGDFVSADVMNVSAETAYRLGLRTAAVIGYLPATKKRKSRR